MISYITFQRFSNTETYFKKLFPNATIQSFQFSSSLILYRKNLLLNITKLEAEADNVNKHFSEGEVMNPNFAHLPTAPWLGSGNRFREVSGDIQ